VPSKSPSTSATELFTQLRERVVEGPAELDHRVRRAAFAGENVPSEARDYTDKVRRHAYKVTDSDIAALRAAGWTEEAIFELTIVTAVGSALSRLDIATAVLAQARGE
jgi:alkylhydroperoxidase family enzyme